MGDAMLRQATEVRDDLTREARSLFEREPLGWDLGTLTTIYRWALDFPGHIAALINDRIAHLNVIEAFGQEQREVNRLRSNSKRMRNSLVQRARVVGLLRALSEASAGFASGAVELLSGLDGALLLTLEGAAHVARGALAG